jgi:predicted nucleic acid-binding protein
MEGHQGEDLVIDASVAVKWFTEEAGTSAAVRLRDSHIAGRVNLVAPDLLFYEVLNALRYKGVAEDILKGYVQDLVDLQMDLIPPNQHLMEKTVLNSLRFDLTVYDAAYLTLAHLLGSKLVTADKKFHKAVKGSGITSLLK